MDKKIALVTGASRGIGEAIALELSRNNIFVVGTATSDIGVKKIQEMLQVDTKGVGAGLILNANNNESIETLIKNIEED